MRQPSSFISRIQSGPFVGRSISRQVAKGMKSRSVLAPLRTFLAGGAFPTSGFLATFDGRLGPRPRLVAFVTFTGFDLGLGTLPSIWRQGWPISSDSTNDVPSLLRRTYLLSVPVSTSSHLRTRRGILQQFMLSLSLDRRSTSLRAWC